MVRVKTGGSVSKVFASSIRKPKEKRDPMGWQTWASWVKAHYSVVDEEGEGG